LASCGDSGRGTTVSRKGGRAVGPTRSHGPAAHMRARSSGLRGVRRAACDRIRSADRMGTPAPHLSLVHLSDVHFQKRKVDGTYDLDREVRNELELDLRTLAPAVGHITGVVVTGDIAYAADPAEFRAASAWLATVCEIVRCPTESVWTSPGNHDVDRRNVIEKSEIVRLLQSELRGNPSRFERLIQDKSAAEALFKPLAAYNEFAGKFGCDLGPDRLVWRQDLDLNDGSKLRLYGLNSTLTSCNLDDEGTRLVLGDMAHALLREPGVALVSLCHHPPDWLVDHDAATGLLNSKTRLQLFGHKHSQRIEQINDSLRITAGAVHPERTEKQWEPRYSVISCRVLGTGEKRALEVVVHARVWSKASRTFVEDTTDPRASRPITLPLEAWTAPEAPVPPPPACSPGVGVSEARPGEPQAQPPPVPSMDPARRLTYRFLTLPYHERMAVANALKLLGDDDKGLPDRVLFERLLQRAAQRGLRAQLWAEVEQRHGAPPEPNPYVGS
jgi:hypothetical protein